MPVASASLARGLSSSVNSSVSAGSMSFRRNPPPLVMRNGFAILRAFLIILLVFTVWISTCCLLESRTNLFDGAVHQEPMFTIQVRTLLLCATDRLLHLADISWMNPLEHLIQCGFNRSVKSNNSIRLLRPGDFSGGN